MGQKYAIFNEEGLPKAFYDSEIHTEIPQEAIPITEGQWLEFVNNQGTRKWNFEKNEVEAYTPPLPPKDELFESKKHQLMLQEINRLDQILKQHGFLSLSDVQLYASNNDAEAKQLLSWYLTYDDLIWQYIDTLQKLSQQELSKLNIIHIEEEIFNKTKHLLEANV